MEIFLTPDTQKSTNKGLDSSAIMILFMRGAMKWGRLRSLRLGLQPGYDRRSLGDRMALKGSGGDKESPRAPVIISSPQAANHSCLGFACLSLAPQNGRSGPQVVRNSWLDVSRELRLAQRRWESERGWARSPSCLGVHLSDSYVFFSLTVVSFIKCRTVKINAAEILIWLDGRAVGFWYMQRQTLTTRMRGLMIEVPFFVTFWGGLGLDH